jgi:ribonuclease HII
LAYSLVVCGVKAPKDWSIEGLNDSKKLTEKKRLIIGLQLPSYANKGDISFYIAERSNIIIDELGMAKALKDAYVEVFHKLYSTDSLIICDGTLKFDNLGVDDYDQVSLIKADGQVPAVMAASILAKNYRDGKMKQLHCEYPQYNFYKNVGYGSSEHLSAIEKYGPSPLHRISYAPMKNMSIEKRSKFSLVSPGVGNRKNDI